MRFLKYQIIVSEKSIDDNTGLIEPVISEKKISYSAANEEIAKSEAYNGEYEIIDDGEPEPVIPPTNDELAAENKRLKAQMEMQAQNITFLENCLLEMGDIVYA